MIITELAVFEFRNNQMYLIETAEGVDVDMVKAHTTAKFTVADDLKTMSIAGAIAS